MKKNLAKELGEKRAVAMLGEIDELYDDAETKWRTKHGARTVENVAFYRGIQWLTKTSIDKNGRFKNEMGNQRGELTEVINFSQTMVNESVADALSQELALKIPSAKNDPRARGRANMTEKLGRSFTRSGVFDLEERFNVTLWSYITGGGWVKAGWDPFAGKHLRNVDNGFGDEEDMGDDNSSMQLNVPFMGELYTEYVSSVDGLPAAAAKNTSRQQMPHFFHRKHYTIRECEEMWPVDAFGKKTKGRWDDGTHSSEQAFVRSVSDELATSMESAQGFMGLQQNRLAMVREFWELPSRRYPNGRLVISSGPMILYAGENPLTPARIPFVLYRGPNRIPDGLYADGLMELLKPIQRTANKLATKIMEIASKMANPHLLVPIGSGIDKNIWGTIPGQIIPYFKGFKPDVMNGADPPAWLFDYLNQQLERAMFLTGISEAARGDLSSGTSGRTFAFANQQHQRLRAPQRASQKRSDLAVIQHLVWLAREKYEDGRLIQMLGDEIDDMDLIEFRGDDYDWDTDFVPEAYSEEPQTLQEKVSLALELKGGGFFEDDPAAERMRRYIGQDFATKAAFDPFDDDRQNAQRENQKLVTDPIYEPVAQTYDTDRIHLEVHNKFRRSVQYANLPAWRRATMDKHCEIHSLKMKLNEMGDEPENMLGPRPGMNMANPNPQQLPAGPGMESPIDGGAGAAEPAPAPPVDNFAAMSDSEQRASDQQ